MDIYSGELGTGAIPQLLAAFSSEKVTKLSRSDDPFERLVTIDDLEALLSRLLVSPGLVRLSHNGSDVPHDEYLDASVSPIAQQRPIRADNLTQFLLAGATLFIYHCDSMLPNVFGLCQRLAEIFKIRVGAGLVLTMTAGTPTPAHWDGCDMLLIQLVGTKQWDVYQPFKSHPLRSEQHEVTSSVPAWSDLMTPGDALYVPRGWPHRVTCATPPSVHLGFDLRRPTGTHLLRNIVNHLTNVDALVRSDIPLLESKERRHVHNELLREVILGATTDDKLDAYYDAYLLNTHRRTVTLSR